VLTIISVIFQHIDGNPKSRKDPHLDGVIYDMNGDPEVVRKRHRAHPTNPNFKQKRSTTLSKGDNKNNNVNLFNVTYY